MGVGKPVGVTKEADEARAKLEAALTTGGTQAITYNGRLVIVMDVSNPPVASKTGNTLLVSSTRGAKETTIRANNKAVYINVNAYVYSEGRKSPAEAEAAKKAKAAANTINQDPEPKDGE